MDKQREEFLTLLGKLPQEKLEVMRNFMWLFVYNTEFKAEYDKLFPPDKTDPDWKTVDALVKWWMQKIHLEVSA